MGDEREKQLRNGKGERADNEPFGKGEEKLNGRLQEEEYELERISIPE